MEDLEANVVRCNKVSNSIISKVMPIPVRFYTLLKCSFTPKAAFIISSAFIVTLIGTSNVMAKPKDSLPDSAKSEVNSRTIASKTTQPEYYRARARLAVRELQKIAKKLLASRKYQCRQKGFKILYTERYVPFYLYQLRDTDQYISSRRDLAVARLQEIEKFAVSDARTLNYCLQRLSRN